MKNKTFAASLIMQSVAFFAAHGLYMLTFENVTVAVVGAAVTAVWIEGLV